MQYMFVCMYTMYMYTSVQCVQQNGMTNVVDAVSSSFETQGGIWVGSELPAVSPLQIFVRIKPNIFIRWSASCFSSLEPFLFHNQFQTNSFVFHVFCFCFYVRAHTRDSFLRALVDLTGNCRLCDRRDESIDCGRKQADSLTNNLP